MNTKDQADRIFDLAEEYIQATLRHEAACQANMTEHAHYRLLADGARAKLIEAVKKLGQS